MVRGRVIVAIAAALLAIPSHAVARPGDLNSAFSGDGLHVVDLGSTRDHGAAMAVQPDGKVVVAGSRAGDAYVARFTSQGALDPDFGTGGVVTEAFGPADVSSASGLVLQGDGKIVIAGYVDADPSAVTRDDDMAVARFEADGDPDPGFGDSGRRVVSFGGGFDQASAVAVQPDGKVVAAGRTTVNDATGDDIAIVRLTTAGNPDDSFDDDGKQITAIDPANARDDYASAVAVIPGPKVLVAGETDTGGDTYDAVVLRYGNDGKLDSGWSDDGVARLHAGQYTTATSMALRADGSVLIGGASSVGDDAADLLFARFTASGVIDGSFGAAGRRLASVSPTGYEQLDALAVQPDGRILGVGFTRTATRAEEIVAVRLSPRGDLDLGFGAEGRRAISFHPNAARADFAFDVAIAAGGTSALVLARTAPAAPVDDSDSDLAFVSLLLAGPADRDYDGVPDALDRCPLKRHATAIGCPDADGDRVADGEDFFPHYPGRHLKPATAGDDTIVGTYLGEVIAGKAGDDRLLGRGGADTLRGGRGNDRLVGDAGRDAFEGGAGNDSINARDGTKETVACGRGTKDVATVDALDTAKGCETVRRP